MKGSPVQVASDTKLGRRYQSVARCWGCHPEGPGRADVGGRQEPFAVQQGQLNPCSSPGVHSKTPTNSYFRRKNPLKHWRQACHFVHWDQRYKEKVNKQSNPINPSLTGPDTSSQLWSLVG